MKWTSGISIFLMLCALSSSYTHAQNTVVEGVILEDDTERPVSFAKVYFMGTQTGTTTDTAGIFNLEISEKDIKFDTLIVSLLGFKTTKVHVVKGQEQNLTIRLYSSLFQEVDEMTAKAGENPAWAFMRRLIAAKMQNNPDNLNTYTAEEYSKVRFDLNHFTDKIKKNLILRPFDYIWDNTKKTEDGITYLPVLMTETVSEHYYRKSPKDEKNIILGEKTTGLAGPNLMKFTNDLYLTPNIYENYISILGKSFPSPLNDNYKMNYRFYLMDSTWTDTSKTYKIRFRPKHKRELGFTGEMYIDSATYAITEINLRFDVMANVNFVRSYYISQKYTKVDDSHFMLAESNVVGDFTVLENSTDMTGFFGRKKAIFSNYRINEEIDEQKLKGAELTLYEDSATVQTDNFWEKHRQEEFNSEEESLFKVTDRVLNDPAFKFRKNLLYTIVNGFIPVKALQIGNIYSIYNFNQIEESRVKLGLRTNPDNVFPWHFSAYGAYGFGDKQWKYNLTSFVNLTKKGTTQLGGSYSYDIQQLGRSFNQYDLDHIINSFAQIGNSPARNYVTSFEGYFEKSIATGVTTRLTYFNTQFAPTADTIYREIDDLGNIELNSLYRTSGMRAVFKFSYLYKDVKGTFYDDKDYYNEVRKYPDIALGYEYADKTIFGSQFDYQKLRLSIRQKVNARKLGHFTYNLEMGKTFGVVPHVLLDIPFANQMIINDSYAFNLMRYMEFAADEYLAVHFSHHFDGLILDRIPLINKLKWRSFIFVKAYYGSLSAANRNQTYLLPERTSAMGAPYYEVGFGIENIFKVARMDFTWRLTPGEHANIYYFLVKPSLQFSF